MGGGQWEVQLVSVSHGEKDPTTARPLSPAPRCTCQAERLKNNSSTFERNEGDDADNFLRSAEKVLSARDTAWGCPCPLGTSRDPPRRHSPAAAGLGPPRGSQCLHLSRGEEGEGGSRSGAPNFSTAAGREPRRRAARPGRRQEAGRATAAGRARLALLGRARDAERRATAPGAAGGVPQPPRGAEPAPELAGPQPGRRRQVLHARSTGPVGSSAAPGARRWRHLPGSSRTVAMGMARRPGEELAPRGRTGCSDAERARAEGELLPALSAQRRHGRPPGVSALPRDPHPTTLRPLPPPPPPPPPPPRRPPPTPHTLPSCSGEPLPLLRHFRAQVARSGPGAGGCRGGGGHSGGISVPEC